MTSKMRIWFIVIFWFVVAIFLLLGVEICRAQTPPAPVIDYNWYPDPLGIWLCNLDIYRILQQHTAEDDTLHNRIDSMLAQVFYAYDSVGGLDVSVLDERQIRLDTEIYKDDIYSHADGDSIVAINADGLYRINAAASIAADTPTDVTWYLYLYIFSSASWYQMPCGVAYGHAGSSYSLIGSVSLDVIYPFDSGDSVQVRIVAVAGDNITTVAGTVHLMIEKIQ